MYVIPAARMRCNGVTTASKNSFCVGKETCTRNSVADLAEVLCAVFVCIDLLYQH